MSFQISATPRRQIYLSLLMIQVRLAFVLFVFQFEILVLGGTNLSRESILTIGR